MCMCEVYKTLSKRKCARVHYLRKRPLENLYWFVYRSYSEKYESIVNVTYYWFLKRKRRSLLCRFQIAIRYISILGHYFFFDTSMFYYLFLYDVTLKPEVMVSVVSMMDSRSYNCIYYYNVQLLSVWADCDNTLFYLVQL